MLVEFASASLASLLDEFLIYSVVDEASCLVKQ
jgi:hypothetical protein